MKSFTTVLVLAGCAGQAIAFPAVMKAAMADKAAKAARSEPKASSESLYKRVLGVLPGFDAAAQLVSTSGANAFVPPGHGDARGPCPGLNAMANHNYIPHNGVASITQFIKGTFEVFGMGTDIAAFLAAYGAAVDGDGTQWSIGGPVPQMPGLLGLGQPQGISGSHNKYESDVSPTRGDLYEDRNNYLLQMSQFNDLYSQPLGPNGYDLTTLGAFRSKRFSESIANNPYFFNGPFSGVLVQPAAYTFIYRFMGNKSAEFPQGYLNGDVLKSFFAVSGEPGAFTYQAGWERIPNNWYKRAIGDEYTIPFFNVDLLAEAVADPRFLSVGGNTGTTNSFTGVNVGDLTGGVFNANSLLQGNNLACFAFQFLQQAEPDLLKGVVSGLLNLESQITNAVGAAIAGLACPQLSSIDMSQFNKFPGYTKLSAQGTF